MDWSRLGQVGFTWNFFFSLISIILIDLMLAGAMGVPVEKACELMDKEFKPTILEDMILLWVFYGRDRAYA